MPRNASGVYSLPEAAFVAGTIIESAKVNSDLSDIGTALTQSLATTGVSSMSGQFKAAAGSVSSPGIVFSGSLTTGFYRSAADEISWAAAGVQRGIFAASGAVTFSQSLSVGTTLSVTGAATFSSTMSAAGIFTASSDLVVVGSVTIGNALRVAGTVSVGGAAVFGSNIAVIGSVSGGLAVSATLAVGGSVYIGGDMSVGGNFSGKLVAIIEYEEAIGVAGAALTESGLTVRALNTVVYSYSGVVALASDTITIQPGSWHISWYALIGANTGTIGNTPHQTMLINASTSASLKRSLSSRTDIGNDTVGTQNQSFGIAVVSVAATTTFQLVHECGNNASGNLVQGIAASLGSEIYTQVVIKAA